MKVPGRQVLSSVVARCLGVVVVGVAHAVRDLADSAAFYDAVLAPLGGKRLMDVGEVIGYGTAGPSFWLGPVTTGGEACEAHIAFAAADRAAVEAFHDAAVDPRGGGAARVEGVAVSSGTTTRVVSPSKALHQAPATHGQCHGSRDLRCLSPDQVAIILGLALQAGAPTTRAAVRRTR
jgi:catechol 2,3-dioxygenase-like lactoylglutathione lyase family enzyme